MVIVTSVLHYAADTWTLKKRYKQVTSSLDEMLTMNLNLKLATEENKRNNSDNLAEREREREQYKRP